mgnify:CR=1 FL=1
MHEPHQQTEHFAVLRQIDDPTGFSHSVYGRKPPTELREIGFVCSDEDVIGRSKDNVHGDGAFCDCVHGVYIVKCPVFMPALRDGTDQDILARSWNRNLLWTLSRNLLS